MTDLWSAGTGVFGGRGHWTSRGLAPVASLLMACAPAWAGPAKPACELIAVQEVVKALGATVTIDRSASGPDPNGGDNCVWVTADRRNVMLRVVAVPKAERVKLTYGLELGSAFGGGKPPEALPGFADEAKYRVYSGNLTGGVVVGRKGQVVFVVEGRTGRESLIDLTRALLSRL